MSLGGCVFLEASKVPRANGQGGGRSSGPNLPCGGQPKEALDPASSALAFASSIRLRGWMGNRVCWAPGRGPVLMGKAEQLSLLGFQQLLSAGY